MGTPLAAQDESAETDAIVVSAQRSGAPMWIVDGPRGTLVLVGEITAIPKSTPWYPDRLEEATREAERVILGTRSRVSPGDVLRLIFGGSRITRLPDRTVAADYLDAGQMARLTALEQLYDEDYSRRSLLMTSFDLFTRRLRFNRDTGPDASDVVRRAASRARVPAEPVGTVRGEDVLDNLAEADPRSHIPCLEAAMTAAEAGRDIVEQRADAWRAFDVPAVMANPLELALGKCWPWADSDLGGELRGQWTEALASASEAEGVTLAVVPLRVLAEEDGVLDQLQSRGLDISGPDWR
ncbi:TraB/GumN family protein [Altererythrobacter sp. KTW20L]|nr:TraB/GumN family protein [Altererythrobacter sp. KTW20L]MCL6250126.1 TraB/GumN family protein [Altererythrobacter sp. KTW20L]